MQGSRAKQRMEHAGVLLTRNRGGGRDGGAMRQSTVDSNGALGERQASEN